MRRGYWSRRIVVGAVLVTLLLLSPARHGSAQQPPPAGAATPAPGLTLQISQQQVREPATGTLQQLTIVFGSAAAVQVRLFEDGTTLLFDGLGGGGNGRQVRTFPRVCGQQHVYDLYAIAGGVVVASRSTAVRLCAGDPPAAPSPSPTATGAAAAAPATPPVPAALAPAAAQPSAPVTSPAPSQAATQPGQPPVPAPPLEPPSLAMADGFVLAQPDDFTAASAAAAGVPLVRLLAIWLRGADSAGSGSGAYQYVQIANLGGATQDLTGWALQGDSGSVAGLVYYFPDGFTLAPGNGCRIYVGHPAEATCTAGSFALYQFWTDHGAASLWDGQGNMIDQLGY